MVITVVDRATGATGNYDGEPKVGSVITLKSPIGITVEPIASDGKSARSAMCSSTPIPIPHGGRFRSRRARTDGWYQGAEPRDLESSRVESGAMRGYVEGSRSRRAPANTNESRFAWRRGPDFEVELAAGLELTDLGVYLRRRLPSDAASIKSIRPCGNPRRDSGSRRADHPRGHPPRRVQRCQIVGLRGTDEQWIAAAEEVRVAGSQVSRCAVWSAQRRRVSLRYKGGEDPSALVGLRLVPWIDSSGLAAS